MRLLLIRHGQTIDNVHGVLGAVVPGPGLTELGQQQALAVREMVRDERIEGIFVSSMIRTQHTAAPLAAERGLTPVELPGLREISSGDLEGRSDKESVRRYVDPIVGWWHDLELRVPGGESGTEFFARYDDAIGRIASQHSGTVAVFSHGAAIRTWAAASSRNLNEDNTRGLFLDNTGIVIVEGSPAEGWIVTMWAGRPLGGDELDDGSAADPAGEELGIASESSR
jgi:broad specificity phosphatase PhoE